MVRAHHRFRGEEPVFKRALISVSDKTHLEKLGKFLSDQGCEIVSTGGSAKALKAAGLSVVEVSELTGFPEVMDGRVKTLHPKIHMGLLARKDHEEDLKTLKDLGGVLFDLVVVNLYPFEETLKKSVPLKDQVEQIDIGGPTLLRAACKSYERITVLSSPAQYELIFKGAPDEGQRRRLAAEAFSHVSAYDSLVARFLCAEPLQETSISGRLVKELRYGENPHQSAKWYARLGAEEGWQDAEILQGKELSYNNLLDLDAAQACLSSLPASSCVVVKHNNPCGAAQGKNLLEAVHAALEADPLSCFGGIVAVNEAMDEAVALRLSELFLECVVAPEISEGARKIFAKKKNQRVLVSKGFSAEAQTSSKFISLWGGFLVQDQDAPSEWNEKWAVIGDAPSEETKRDLIFAWKICAYLKSNAIALVSGGKTLGLGMGQVSRVDAVAQALERKARFHAGVVGTVAASDAFFPFPDSIEKFADAGVKWVIQPGGSISDEKVITRARELGINMVLTGTRHFRH